MDLRGMGAGAAGTRDLDEAARQFEALAIKQILAASGAFDLGGAAGASVNEGLFLDTLADELSRAGGLGIATMLTRELGSGATHGSAAPVPDGFGMPSRAPAPVAPALHMHHDGLDPTDLTSGVGRITSSFGVRNDPFDGSLHQHRGVDVGAPEGTEIRAAADGVVRRSGARGGYGNAIEIDHGNGVTTLYAHAAELKVAEGTRVTRGEVIGTVGSTGRATGAHLHFEVRVDDRPVSPTRALKAYEIGAE